MSAKHSFYGEHYSKMPRSPPTAIAVPPPPGGGLNIRSLYIHSSSAAAILQSTLPTRRKILLVR